MTEDFKKRLIDYLTNSINATSPTPKTSFDESDVLDDSVWDSILPSGYEDLHFNGSVVDSISNKVILYGYYTLNSVDKGIIVILDETFTPIKVFTSYSNATELNPIQCMKQAEDGTYYLIDKVTNLRFVMVNNFSLQNANSEYVLDFRRSYNFDNSFNNYTVEEMYKSGTSAKYVFFSKYNASIKVIELTVNVGEPIAWSSAITISDKYFGGAYALFNDDGVFWRMITTTNIGIYDVIGYTKDYTQTTPTSVNISLLNNNEFILGKKRCVFVDQDNVYFVCTKSGTAIRFYKYSFDEATLTTIYTKNLTDYDESIDLALCDGFVYAEYVTNIVNTTGSLIPEQNGYHGDYYFQRMTEDVWNPILYETNEYFRDLNHLFIAKADFNLVQLYSFYFNDLQRYILLLKDDFNSLEYNGNPYVDYNSLISQRIRIYSDNSLVFARNILDRTITDNKTISTAIIPNTYLNNMRLDKENLVSQTNMVITEQNTSITKNVYESIYLNFVNNIRSKPLYIGSGPSHNTKLNINSTTNSYITTNINIGTEENCQDTFMAWLIVNYADGTTMQNPIVWELSPHSGTPGQYYYRFNWAIDVQKEITSYEVKSYDLEQTYFTAINGEYPTNLEVGETYRLQEMISFN